MDLIDLILCNQISMDIVFIVNSPNYDVQVLHHKL